MAPSAETTAGFIVIWEFEVAQEKVAAFEKLYGPIGGWAKLFRQSPGYLKTELLRNTVEPTRYTTVDYWRSRTEYDQFKQQHAAEYLLLDQQGDRLTTAERLVGTIEPDATARA